MSGKLIITVGTSLFHSASWRSEGPFAEITDYHHWREDPQRGQPLARQAWAAEANGATMAGQIKDILVADAENASVVELFDSGFEPPGGQYSAEISTLIAMRLKLDRHVSFAEFLQSYSSIVFLHGGRRNPAEAVARHLAAVLRRHAQVTTADCRMLEGSTIQQQLPSLVSYLEGLQGEPADLVATGGYKAFAVTMGHIYWQRSAEGWRLFYLHEADMGDLIQEWQMGTARVVETKETVIRYRPEGPHIS